MWMIRLELGRVQTDSTAAMFLFSFDWDTFISLSGILNMIRGKDASSNTVMVVKVIFLLRVKLMERSEGRGYRQADNGAPRGRVLSLILLLMMINCTIEEKPEVGWHDLKERQRLSQMCSFRLLEETTGASECCSLCADLSKHVNNIEPTDPQVMVFFMVTPSTCHPHLVLYRPHTCLCGLVLHELPAPLSPQTLLGPPVPWGVSSHPCRWAPSLQIHVQLFLQLLAGRLGWTDLEIWVQHLVFVALESSTVPFLWYLCTRLWVTTLFLWPWGSSSFWFRLLHSLDRAVGDGFELFPDDSCGTQLFYYYVHLFDSFWIQCVLAENGVNKLRS